LGKDKDLFEKKESILDNDRIDCDDEEEESSELTLSACLIWLGILTIFV